MVRIATEQDAAQLQMLNNEFNGEGETTLENIRASLTANRQEVVIIVRGRRDTSCKKTFREIKLQPLALSSFIDDE